ncbi:MAG: serine/threonine-protein kinase [Planctomycetota bacterium]|nr:serine/threonine-protein kinase [Planctomycetota bacterium]
MIRNASPQDPFDDVASEFIEGCRSGVNPSIDDYVNRYPDLADCIRDLFPTIVALESAKRADRTEAARCATLHPLVLTELGDFRIIREIGRGGMGIVYEAEQRSLGRKVALKVLPKQSLLDPKQLRRFQSEARIAARLHHSNIVSLHGVGEHDGYHFIVMQLIVGAPLDAVVKCLALGCGKDSDRCIATENSLQQIVPLLFAPGDPTCLSTVRSGADYWRNCARIVRDAARALQYAFDQGVLHRDVKPGNLLLDRAGNVWISDFGLAQAMHGDGMLHSHSASIGGTLSYMSPESLAGQTDERSDLYGLGLTLYELLTLEQAFPERTPAESIQRIANQSFQPARPQERNPNIPRDLETVVLKAIAAEPSQRYASAGALADDLQRFLDNRPVQARRISTLVRIGRWCQRNKMVSALSALAILLLALVFNVITFSYLHAIRANQETQLALQCEISERENSAATLQIAVDALDGIYEQFAPNDVNDYSEPKSVKAESDQIAQASTATPSLSAETAVVLENLLKFYHRLGKERGDSLLLSESSIKALGRIGDIHRQLGQSDRALGHYSEALVTLDRLRNDYPAQLQLTLEAARIHNEIGRVYFVQEKYSEAERAHQQAIQLLTASKVDGSLQPPSANRLFEVARAHYYLGRRPLDSASQVAMGQLVGKRPPPHHGEARGPTIGGSTSSDRKRTHLLAAINLLNELPDGGKRSVEHAFLLACCYRELPNARPKKGDDLRIGDSRSHQEQALAILNDLVRRFPDNPHYRFELVEAIRLSKPDKTHKHDQVDESQELLYEALAHADYLIEHHPNVPQYAVARMHVLHRLGHVQTHQAREHFGEERDELLFQAQGSHEKAREQIRLVTARWPGEYSFKLWSAVVDGSLAQVCLDLGLKSEASTNIDSAIATLDKILKEKQSAPAVEQHLSEVYMALLELDQRANIGIEIGMPVRYPPPE